MASTASLAAGAWRALIGLLILLATLPAGADGNGSASTTTDRGLHTTTFQTDRGTVEVRLPDDLAAGDTLSGTVVARPSGRTAATTRRNADRLEGYVVELGEGRTEVRAGAFSWSVPAAVATSVTVVLRDNRGREVARDTVPVAPAARSPVTAGPSAPEVGQTGRPVAIDGAFDGRFGSSRVTIGAREAPLLAESPRKLVVESPTEVVGETTLVVTEGDATSEWPFRNLEILLSAPRTDLSRGERTTLRVEVSGLKGLREPIPIRVRNETPAVVRIEDGDTQTITIEPAEVGEEGRFVASRAIIGLGVGGFGISARIAGPEDLGGPVAQAQPEPKPQPAPEPPPETERDSTPGAEPETEPDATSPGGETGGSGTEEPAQPETEEETPPATFQDVNDRLDEAARPPPARSSSAGETPGSKAVTDSGSVATG